MKLAIIVCGKSPTTMPGGLGSYSYNIAKIFYELGYSVHLIGYGDKNDCSELKFGVLHQIENPYLKLVSFGNFLIAPRITEKVHAIISKTGPEEVIIFGAAIWGKVGIDVKNNIGLDKIKITTIASYFTTYKHEYEGQVKGAPIADYGVFYNVCLRMLLFVTSLYHSRQEQNVLDNIDKIIVHYNSAVDIIKNEFPDINAEKIKKIPYYIDLYDRASERHPGNLNKNKIRIVTICRHDPRKGINTLLKAVKIMRDAGLEFECIIAGTGFFRNKHIQLSEKLGISESVSFPGFIKSSEELLTSSDIFVISSVEEGSGAVSVLEAMKCGIPIVSTACDGIPEDLTDRETAVLVEENNAQSLAEALQLLIEDKQLRSILSQNALIKFNKHFSFERMKDGLNSVLTDHT